MCLRILAPRWTPEDRRRAVRTTETYIQKGEWIPGWRVKDVALLFYPNDPTLELALLANLNNAIQSKELINIAGGDVLLASDLASWPDCPPVPADSPLRYWLPDWMQATPEPKAVTGSFAPKPMQRSAAQDAAIINEIRGQGLDPLALPKNKPGKAGIKSSIKTALQGSELFVGPTIFTKAWERLTANGDIVIKG